MIRPIGEDAAQNEPNHFKVWGVALLVAIPLTFVFNFMLGFLFAILPNAILDILFLNYDLFRLAVFAGVTAATALLLYKMGIFTKEGGTGQQRFSVSPAAGGMGLGVSGGGSIASAQSGAPQTSSLSADTVLPEPTFMAIVHHKRHCTGDFYLADGRVVFVCLKDQTVAQANAGQAVARQFGLLGALIGAVISSLGSKKREGEMNEARAKADAVGFPERLSLNEFSFDLAASDITLAKGSFWSGVFIESSGDKYVLQGASKQNKVDLAAWCQANQVAQQGLS